MEFPDERSWHTNVSAFGRIGDETRRRSLHGCLSRSKARFEAMPNMKSDLLESSEIVAVEMPIATDDTRTTTSILEECGAAQRDCGWVEISQDHTTARTKHPAQLGDRSDQIRDMLESQRANHKVDAR